MLANKMMTNSFGNKSFMQTMRRLSMHSQEVQLFSFQGREWPGHGKG
jgi:hypothetical protein